VDLAIERNRLRGINTQDPEIQRLNNLISEVSSREAKNSWIENVQASHPRVSTNTHWRLLRILSGKRPRQSPNQPISFSNKSFSKPTAVARRFCRQFTSVTVHKTNKRSRCVNRNLKKKHHLDSAFVPFNEAITKEAILRSSNSTAFGPDGLKSLQLKALDLRP
jgi:hypothetical protein